MSVNRLPGYLEHMVEACELAIDHVGEMDRLEFLNDRKTQQAVIWNILVIGEAATNLLKEYGSFVGRFPDIPWKSMKGMRNRMAHGYFDINLDVVWDTVHLSLPDLLEHLPEVLEAANAEAE